MRKVELAPGIHSSVLGFGCAPILGAVGGAEASRAIETALDCGVNHFDLARSYGYGEAERFVGRFLKRRREDMVVASKFGIRATWKASLLRPLKPVVRKLKGPRSTPVETSKGARSSMSSKSSDPFHERIDLTPANMRGSLEQSLRALGTDYLDLFFVHEPVGEIQRIDDLAAMAQKLKQEGKIRAWGLAFDWSSEIYLRPVLPNFDLLQFNCSLGADHYFTAWRERAGSPSVLFSPLRNAGNAAPKKVLQQLWSDFPVSVVLCSMFDPKHILENAAAANSVRDAPAD